MLPPFRPRLLAFDLDGTLLPDGTHELDRETHAVLQGFRAAGVKVVVITGRSALRGSLAEIAFLDAVAVCNGAEIAFADGTQMCQFLSESETEQLAELADPSLPLRFYVLENDVAINAPPAAWVGDVRKLPSIPENAEMRRRILKVRCNFTGAGLWAARLCKTMPHLMVAGGVGIYPDAVDVSAQGANKGAALCHIAGHFAVPISQTIAFGDSDNDVPLLAAAGFGVQVGTHAHLDALADVRLAAQKDLLGYLQKLLQDIHLLTSPQ